MSRNTDENYKELGNAIVISAANDLRRHYRNVKIGKDSASRLKSDMRFFNSAWYGVLTSVDGGYIVENIKSEVDNELYQKWLKDHATLNSVG